MYEDIKSYHNLHDGKRLFIMASGPSINNLDLSRLERRIVMGLNRSFFAYPKSYYHCCMDQRLFDLYPEELKAVRTLFTIKGRPWGVPINLLGAEGFSENLEEGVYTGYTISFVALQIALYLGFSEIFFLGLDLKHQPGKTHFFGSDFHSRNHEDTEFPKMKKMLEFAAEKITSKNVEIYNCSTSTDLTCFPYIDYEEAVSR